MVKCTQCGYEIEPREGVVDWFGSTHCIECAKRLDTCDNCGAKFDINADEGIVFGEEKTLCNRCVDDLDIVQCKHCSKYIDLEDSVDIEDDVYCRECIDQGKVDYDYCESCGRMLYTDSMVYIDDCSYCPACADDMQESCSICDRDVASEDISKRYRTCAKCVVIAKIREENQKSPGFTNEDVYAMYPDLDARIEALFEQSASLRETVKASPSRKELVHMFPNFSFDFDGLTFTDNDTKEKFDLSNLARTRNAYTRELQAQTRQSIKGWVDMIYNARSHRQKVHGKIKTVASGYLLEAIRARFSRERRNPRIKEIVDDISGIYKHGDLKIIITNDPVAVLGKSTGQCWEELSCEKAIDGMFGTGPFSDVLNSNPVVFAVNKKKQVVGRIMLRYGKANGDNHLDFGIESKWYVCNQDPANPRPNEDIGVSRYTTSMYTFQGSYVQIKDATRFLISILKTKGFYDYTMCRTPYTYDGYSDTMSRGHVHCEYTKLTF